MGTPPPTWADIAWLREQWDGPFPLKGVVRVDDAKHAVDAGVSAITVSNHRGKNLDGAPAAIRCLPAIAEEVGDQVEVLLDGGVRRGSDVVKAVAPGARAVMICARLWGLAATCGVWRPKGRPAWRTSCRAGSTRRCVGWEGSIHDPAADDVLVPLGFLRTLGLPPTTGN